MPRSLLLVLATLPLVASESFPHERAGALPADPAITWGVLPNGLRYALQEHHQPAGKAVLRLRIAAGSLHERDDEQGLAHLLEHLAFNGTTHYPPGRLVTDLQHLGLQFGAHTNAHTSFDETVYKLDLPDATPATLSTGLTVLADWAGGMLLLPDEVARERGVVLAEARDRDGWNLRTWRARFAARYAGTLLPQRFPIGLPEVVAQATPAALRGFYDRWYRPQDMLLVVVADAPVATVEPLVAPALGNLTDRSQGAVPPARGPLATTAEPVVLLHQEAEADDTTVSWVHVADAGPRPLVTLADRRREAALTLADRIFARRLHAMIEADPACPLLHVGADSGSWLGLAHAGVDGRARPGRALEAVELLMREARRLRLHGPTLEELAAETKALAQDFTHAVTRAEDRRAPDLADALLQSTALGSVVLSPTQIRDLVTPLLPQLAPADLTAALAETLERPGRSVVEISGREDLGTDGPARVRAVVERVLAAEVPVQESQAIRPWAYATDPQAPLTEVTPPQRSTSGVTWVRRPGVQVAVMPTHAPGQLTVGVRVLIPPCPDPVVAGLVARAFLAGGLGQHTAHDIDVLWAGSGISLEARVEDGVFSLIANATPDQMDVLLDRLRAHLTDPGWRPAPYQRARLTWLEELQADEQDGGRVAQDLLANHLLQGDPSRRPVTAAILAASTADAETCRAWLAPHLASAPLGIAVVGDVRDSAAVLDSVLRRFPARPLPLPAATDTLESARAALLPGQPWRPGRLEQRVSGSVPRTLVRVAWPTDDLLDIRLNRRRNLLAECLTDRLREDLRERLGAAYSPRAQHVPSLTRRGEGALMATVLVEPSQAALVEARIHALAEDLARQGVSEDLTARMVAPVMKLLPTVLVSDRLWMDVVLARPDQQALRLGWADTILSDHESITAAELSALATTTFVRDRAVVIVVTCQP